MCQYHSPITYKAALTAQFCAMLVRVSCSFLIGHACNIEQAIHTSLYGVCALVPELERLFGVGSVFVDHFINLILDR
jgi:hypothetical protein